MTSNVFDDTDFESFSETSSEDQDDIFSIYGGQAQSILSNLEDSIGKIDDFLSFERGYIHGDIIRAVEDPSGQMGKVVQVNMFVDLENVFGEVIRDVSSTKLLRLRSFSVGDYVVHGPWLGRVHKIVDCVSVIFDDGTKCDIMATDPEKLVSISPNLLDDTLYPYHPGQRVRVVVSSLSNSSGWLCGISKKNQNEGTICFVDAGIVFVDWLASAFGDFSVSPPPPSCTPHPGDLTTLSCFPHANWQHGEWCILSVSERSVEANYACPGNLVKEKWKKESGSKRRDFSSKLENMFAIVRKRIKVDVMWQDGTLSRGLDSYSLFPVCALNSHDFFPEQLVLERASSDDSDVAMNQRWGVVKFVDANEHTLKVEWRRIDEDARNLNRKLGEEMVSAYELIEHPDFAFSFGDIVFLLEKHHTVGQPDDMTTGELAMLKAMYGDHGSEQNRCFLSSVGNVVGLKNGNVQVQWATGNTTEVSPYKLVRVDRDDGSITTHFLHEEDVSGANHELAEQEKQSLNQKEMDLLERNHVGEDYPKYDGNSAFFGFPQTAIGLFSSFATKIFGSPDYSSMTQPIPYSPNTKEDDTGTISGPEGQKFSNICVEALQEALPALNVTKDASMKPKIGETSENKELASHLGDDNFEEFKKFDIVGDCSDHHFVNDVGNGSTPFQVKKGWLKKVQHEWSILQQDIPETIYVRIYEERMDLIRAAIVGASGTPYHDGLFFFDIHLPPDYPSEPPMVHYHSGGLRLNPNLYESGRVCLSLLNTWNGMGSEVWNPESSTILQVLLSLQALVLNEKPYFNEAGYDKQIGRVEGEKNSVSYNENAFLVTCRSMLYLLRKPPKNFESLVEGHFKRRSLHILAACKAYMDSTPVGLFGQEINITAENCRGNSTGFKIMLAKLFPKLVEAFSAGGTDSDQFLQFD